MGWHVVVAQGKEAAASACLSDQTTHIRFYGEKEHLRGLLNTISSCVIQYIRFIVFNLTSNPSFLCHLNLVWSGTSVFQDQCHR